MVNAKKHPLLKPSIQIVLAVIAIYAGWELIILIEIPTGNNWMWGHEMLLFSIYLNLIILIGGFVEFKTIRYSSKVPIIIICIQIVSLVLLLVNGYQIRPLRTSFLFACGMFSLLMGNIITHYMTKKKT